MNEKPTRRRLNRRDLLKLGGGGALVLLVGSTVPFAAKRLSSQLTPAEASQAGPLAASAAGARSIVPASAVEVRLAATDGFIKLPGREGNPLYMFGFNKVPTAATINELDIYKGKVQNPAPTIWVREGDDVTLNLTNIGLTVRPDLDDAHTIHWHGFRNPITIFDGVPEITISVPPGRDFPYFYKPLDAGTFMYHCHFEDTEHVQMGMTGVIFVQPSQGDSFCYNDGVALGHPLSTAFDRQFALLLSDVDTRPHDGLKDVQEFVWSDYKANYWIMNGRAYPDTVLPNKGEPGSDPALQFQPISSLIQANAEERILLRFVNLGFEQQAMRLPITMKVIGEDATYLGPKVGPEARGDTTYDTNIVYIGPGESRDVLFTAPPFEGLVGPGHYDTYRLENRNLHRLTNGGAPGLGGQVTEVRVYPPGSVGAQTYPNQTHAVPL